MIIVFLIGYLLIALEHPLKINKAGTALLTGTILWVLYTLGAPQFIPTASAEEFKLFLDAFPFIKDLPYADQCIRFVIDHQILDSIGEIAETLIFLIGAMITVELVDSHGGFMFITNRITTNSKRKLLFVIATITFFMSAVLDNLTTSIVMVMLIRKLIGNYKERWIFGSIIVIAANSGGAWSPIGDVTTIMLWVRGNISTSATIPHLFLPSLVSALVPVLIISRYLHGKVTPPNAFEENRDNLLLKVLKANEKLAILCIGVFCLLARTFANIGFDAFLPMVKYMLGVLLALAVQCLVVYMVLLTVFARINPVKFLKKFVSVMMFAFSTATSNATIPLNIETLEKKMGVDRRISSFTIPLGATINMDGTSIMQGVAVVFTAQLFGVQLGPVEYATVIATATLASIGTAGVPSVGLITLSMVFNSVGLPLEGIALIMGIDRILDMTRTAVNITGDAVCTTIVAKRAGRMDTDVFNDPNAGRELDDVKAA